jgi:hypothetical protein
MKLPRFLASPKLTRVVDNGRVHCPVRSSDVEVDSCFACGFLTSVTRADGQVEELSCNPTYTALVSNAPM